MQLHFRWEDSDLLIRVRLSPNASRDRIGEVIENYLAIAVTSPPVDGKANDHLIRLLAKQFRVAKSRVEIVSGMTSRIKTLRIAAPKNLPVAFQLEAGD